MSPAQIIVPGNPTKPTNRNPLDKTPIAAPMLLAKYNIDIECPGCLGKRRIIPALINGKVIPSKMDYGKIKIPAKIHLKLCARKGLPILGKTMS